MVCKCSPTYFVGTKEAEVTWYFPDNGWGESLVETQRTICPQHSLNHRPDGANVPPQIQKGKVKSAKTENALYIPTSLMKRTFAVLLQLFQSPPFHAWPVGDISPALWGKWPWRRRWKLKTLQKLFGHHWTQTENVSMYKDEWQSSDTMVHIDAKVEMIAMNLHRIIKI